MGPSKFLDPFWAIASNLEFEAIFQNVYSIIELEKLMRIFSNRVYFANFYLFERCREKIKNIVRIVGVHFLSPLP